MKNKIFKKRNIFLILFAIIIFLFSIYYFLYPMVSVNIEPEILTINEKIKLKASLAENNINWEESILPLHKFEVELEENNSIMTSGVKTIGISKAEGLIRIINENQKEILIPKNTIVLSDSSLKYKIIKDIKVPPLKINYLMDHPIERSAGQSEVKIVAEKKGEKYNLESGKINKFSQEFKNVNVVNITPISGGEDEQVKVVSKNDINLLKNKMSQKIKDGVFNSIYQKISGNYRIIDEELSFSKIDYNFNAKEGEVKDKLTASANAIVYGYLLRNSELEKVSSEIIKRQNKDKLTLIDNGINIEKVKLEKIDEKLYNLVLELKLIKLANIDKKSLAHKLAGKTVEEAVNLLHNEDEINNFTIKGHIDYIPKLIYAFKINVEKPNTVSVFKESF
ncbi:MAG: baseplate J/gp47 family protein [Bacillota bacterium]